MSLKAFHLVFIAASILLAFAVAGWGVQSYVTRGGGEDLLLAMISLAGGIGLVIYGMKVRRKLRGVSIL
jgi:hypothetical protein